MKVKGTEVMRRCWVGMIQRNAKRQIIVDFVKWMEMAVVTKYFQEEGRILSERVEEGAHMCNLKDIADCKVDVTRECNRHHMVVCCKGLQE